MILFDLIHYAYIESCYFMYLLILSIENTLKLKQFMALSYNAVCDYLQSFNYTNDT